MHPSLRKEVVFNHRSLRREDEKWRLRNKGSAEKEQLMLVWFCSAPRGYDSAVKVEFVDLSSWLPPAPPGLQGWRQGIAGTT